jgi:transcriptional/translational regulatory protein YebC/TACO1
MFKVKGIIRVPAAGVNEESLLECVLESGAEDMAQDGEVFEITTDPSAFEQVRESVEKMNIKPESAELAKVPENLVKVEGETAAKVLRLLEALDELDDTQKVFSNADFSDSDIAAFNKE